MKIPHEGGVRHSCLSLTIFQEPGFVRVPSGILCVMEAPPLQGLIGSCKFMRRLNSKGQKTTQYANHGVGIMVDLTLDEFGNCSKEDLKRILRVEVKQMFPNDGPIPKTISITTNEPRRNDESCPDDNPPKEGL